MGKSEAKIFTYKLFFICFSVAVGILLFSIGIPFLIGLLHKEANDYLSESSGNEEVVGLTSFEVSMNDVILKVGETFVPDVVCAPDNVDYSLSVIGDNSGKYSINNNEITALLVGECCVFVSVTDNADNTLVEDIDLHIIENVTQMNVVVSSTDINSFVATIGFDKSPIIENLSINFANEDDFVIASQLSEVETNVFEFEFELNNLINADMEFVYNNESSLSRNGLSQTVEVVQDASYFEFCLGDFDSEEVYNLYIFNNNYLEQANSEGYRSSAEIGIVKGFDIVGSAYSLEILGTSISTDNLNINAESEGVSTCNLQFLGGVIATFRVMVSQVDVEEICVENTCLNLKVGDVVSIVPIDILPIFAIYEIQYETQSSGFVIENGILTANDVISNGRVCIYAGNCSVEIIVNIENVIVDTPQITIYDVDSNEIETTYSESFAPNKTYEVRLQYALNEVVEFEIIVDNNVLFVIEEGVVTFSFNQKSNYLVKFIEKGNNSIMKEITIIIT